MICKEDFKRAFDETFGKHNLLVPKEIVMPEESFTAYIPLMDSVTIVRGKTISGTLYGIKITKG